MDAAKREAPGATFDSETTLGVESSATTHNSDWRRNRAHVEWQQVLSSCVLAAVALAGTFCAMGQNEVCCLSLFLRCMHVPLRLPPVLSFQVEGFDGCLRARYTIAILAGGDKRGRSTG